MNLRAEFKALQEQKLTPEQLETNPVMSKVRKAVREHYGLRNTKLLTPDVYAELYEAMDENSKEIDPFVKVFVDNIIEDVIDKLVPENEQNLIEVKAALNNKISAEQSKDPEKSNLKSPEVKISRSSKKVVSFQGQPKAESPEPNEDVDQRSSQPVMTTVKIPPTRHVSRNDLAEREKAYSLANSKNEELAELPVMVGNANASMVVKPQRKGLFAPILLRPNGNNGQESPPISDQQRQSPLVNTFGKSPPPLMGNAFRKSPSPFASGIGAFRKSPSPLIAANGGLGKSHSPSPSVMTKKP